MVNRQLKTARDYRGPKIDHRRVRIHGVRRARQKAPGRADGALWRMRDAFVVVPKVLPIAYLRFTIYMATGREQKITRLVNAFGDPRHGAP